MQSVPAWMYEAMAIVAFAIGIVVLPLALTLIMRAVWGKSPAKANGTPAGETGMAEPAARAATARASTAPAIATILGGGLIWLGGGGLIWLGLHYGFEFHERLIAPISPPVTGKPLPVPSGVPTLSSACNSVDAKYGLIIDAGSSGSRIYIYCWRPGEGNRVPLVTAALGPQGEPLSFKAPSPPLSDVSCESDAGNCLEPLIDYALKTIGNDPQILAQTRIHLMATAGMRLKNPERSKVTMEIVDAYLKERFKPASVVPSRIITGKEEALYGWIAVNYLMGFLRDGSPSATMGILELGGASAQIAYASSDRVTDGKPFRLEDPDPFPQGLAELPWDSRYQIYLQSFDGFGQNRALDDFRSNDSGMNKERKPINPCFPKDPAPAGNYELGERGRNYETCKAAIENNLLSRLANQSKPPQGIFLAYSNYYYTYSFFERFSSEPVRSLADLEKAGRDYCSLKWEEIANKKGLKPEDEKYLPDYCFRAAYTAALLRTKYSFPKETQQIIVTNTLHGNEISWTLGAMIFQAGAKIP